MTQNDTVDTGTNGNTKKSIRARCWFFTWNNFENSDKKLMENFCKKNCEKYTFQEETGKNGTEHLQGAISFKNPRTFDSLKKKFPEVHWEVTRNIDAAFKYCEKEETRTGEIITNLRRPVKDPLKGFELKWWQLEITKLMEEEPDDRKIKWYWDKTGGAGKTSLAKSLCIKYPSKVLYISGKAADIKFGVKTFLDNEKNDLIMCIFDFVRTSENFISYDGIESIKNGIFYNTKYESSMVVFNVPHIVIFANFEPEKSKLSEDRWEIIDVCEEKNIITDEIDEFEKF